MRALLDESLVGLVVLASILYALSSLGPRALRARIMAGTAAVLRRMPRTLGLGGLAQRLHSAASVKSKGACGGCDSRCAKPPVGKPR